MKIAVIKQPSVDTVVVIRNGYPEPGDRDYNEFWGYSGYDEQYEPDVEE